MLKRGRKKKITCPKKLIDYFIEYKTFANCVNENITVNEFINYCKQTHNIGLKHYFSNTHNRYENYIASVQEIKNEIFDSKLNLYKIGKLQHQKICHEMNSRGISFDSINALGNEQIIVKSISCDNPFIMCNNILTIKDTFLKKMSSQSKYIKHKKTPNVLYILNIKGTNIYKIGISSNLKRRIFDLRASNPFPIDIVHFQKCLFPRELEIKIHTLLKDKHIKNEWFKIDDINKIIDIAKLS